MSRRGWWLLATGLVLALAAQAAASGLVWQHTRPRLPGLAPVAALLDGAIARVVSAAGDTAAVTVSGFVPVTACQDTPFAKGSRFSRTADLYTDPGGEDALIRRVAAALPAAEHPHREPPTAGPVAPLAADLGGDLRLRITQLGPGWVTAVAETGCRTGAPQPVDSAAPGTAVTAMTQLLAGLGTAPDGWRVERVSCPAGAIVTVDTLSRTADTDRLADRLLGAVPTTARRFGSGGANRLAWLDHGTSTVVAASDDGTHIAVQRTTAC